MMKVFVLILFVSGGNNSSMGVTHEFNGEAACMQAGQQFAQKWGKSYVYFVCAPKDVP